MVTTPLSMTVSDAPSASNHESSPVETRDAVDRHFLRRGHGAEFEMEAQWVRRNLPDGTDPILDIGCGIGALFPYIGQPRVIGVDHQATGLSLTQKRFPQSRLLCANASKVALGDGVLAGIALQHVLEHLPDAEACCREWQRLLRPGGVLLLLTPNANFRDPRVFDDPTHVRLYHGASLLKLMNSTGFEVMSLRTIGLPWFQDYHSMPGGWRLRRLVLQHAEWLSTLPGFKRSGQTLCCVARSPKS